MQKEPFSKEQFEECMSHNDFVIQEGYVVCQVCSANCGQCGIGNHQGKCQEYLDSHPELLHSPSVRARKIMIGLSLAFLLMGCVYFVIEKAA